MKVINQIGDIIEKTKEDEVVFLGDLINSFSDSLPKVIYNAAFYAIQLWSKNAHLYLILGNHDIYRNMHCFSAMEALPNCEVISSPTKVTIQGYKTDLVPWGYPIPDKNKGDILAGHIPIIGAWVSGDKKKRADEGYSKENLFGYKYAFLGHFHERQQFEVSGGIYAGYIGSVIQINLASSPTDHRGIVFLNSNNQPLFYDIKSPKIEEIIIPTQEAADFFLRETYNNYDYFKLVITGIDVTLPSFDHRVVVEYDIAPSQTARIEETPNEDIREIIDKFIDQANTKLSKTEIKKYLALLEKNV